MTMAVAMVTHILMAIPCISNVLGKLLGNGKTYIFDLHKLSQVKILITLNAIYSVKLIYLATLGMPHFTFVFVCLKLS